MPRGSWNYGDIARVAAGLNPGQLAQYAGTLESITELPRQEVASVLRGLMDGSICGNLPEDARQLLIRVAQTELRLDQR